MFQRSADEEDNYDHKHEYNSTISPYTQRDNAWTEEQYDKSHDRTWN